MKYLSWLPGCFKLQITLFNKKSLEIYQIKVAWFLLALHSWPKLKNMVLKGTINKTPNSTSIHNFYSLIFDFYSLYKIKSDFVSTLTIKVGRKK